MDFDFSQEQYMFQDTVRGLLADLRAPGQLRAGADDVLLWQKLAENGIFALALPEDAGGLGLGFTDLALVFEEFGRALVPGRIAASIVGAALLARYGYGQGALLTRLAEGTARLTLAFAESCANVPQDIRLTGTPTRKGWVVSGEKILVAGPADADALLIALRLEGEGLRLALAERARPGLSLTPAATLDLAGEWSQLRLDAVEILPGDLLSGGEAAVTELFDAAATVSALQMTGAAVNALQETVDYVGQRRQFDRVIGSFQAIKHRCADMAVAVDACRSAAYYAAWALDEAAPVERARAVSLAKSWCGDQGRFVVNQAIQLHGGIGFTWELGLHLYLRRMKLEEASWGDADWHRERVIAATLREAGGAR